MSKNRQKKGNKRKRNAEQSKEINTVCEKNRNEKEGTHVAKIISSEEIPVESIRKRFKIQMITSNIQFTK